MDFVTHALIGAGVARLSSPKREWIPQLGLAGILASELQDADFWLYLIHPSYYGKYHRVASHNLWGLAVVALVCAAMAFGITRVRRWRRFGWFVSDNLPYESEPVSHPPWRWFALVAIISAYLHLAGDVITGFGNILPFWPWSPWDPSLAAVNSFDTVIFASTLGWHIATRVFGETRRREMLFAAFYAAVVVLYVTGRCLWGESTVW